MDDSDFVVEASAPLLSTDQPAHAPSSGNEHRQDTPPSPRKRMIQMGLVVAAFLVVVVLVGLPLATQPLGRKPSIPHQPLPAPHMMLIVSNITFGTVSVNGKPQRGTLPLFFQASPSASGDGAYQLRITAPPFSPLACQLRFFGGKPVTGGDSRCQVLEGPFLKITANGVTATPEYQFAMRFSPDYLPVAQQQQIETLLRHLPPLQQTIGVPAGSYIATRFHPNATISNQQVAASLQATAFQMPSTNMALVGFPCVGLVCSSGLTLGPGFPPDQSRVWAIAVPMALRWQFMTAAGQIVGDASFPATTTGEELLTYSPTAGWSLASGAASRSFSAPGALHDLECGTGSMLLLHRLLPGTIDASAPGSQEVKGCLFTMKDERGANEGTFLWRFGVLLAADPDAHHTLPDLPSAPQAEIDAVGAGLP